jgi:hypothetical protein
VVVGAIYNKCQDYYEQIPEDLFSKMGKSALFTFTITFVFSKQTPGQPYNLSRPLFASGVAALASCIYGLSTPIFNMIFGDERLMFPREVIHQIVNITATSILVNYLNASKVNILALPLVASLSVNLLKSGLDLFPAVAENWFNDPPLADEMRTFFKDWGLDVPDGSSSVFVNFGVFPYLGMD